MGGFLIAGALAFVVELGLCFTRGYGWFLQGSERLLYALSALWLPLLLWGVGLALGRLTALPERVRRRLRWAGSLVLAALGFAVGVSLTGGRWAQGWSLRWPFVLSLVVALGLAVPVARRALRFFAASEGRRRLGAGLLVTLATVLGAVDLWMLPRSYPAFHGLASLGALGVFASLGMLLQRPLPANRWRRPAAVAAALVSLVSLWALARSANAGLAAQMAAPWTGKLLRVGEALAAGGGEHRSLADAGSAPVESARPPSGPGVDLRDRDVLLVTVDALRADVLGAYGGEVGTPAMDALAREGMVFERAYTPTPHTSYALSSMITGKPLREVMALREGATDHRTLPEALRRFGYRTAAFFPPAIFFVDGARFERLAARNFGFEYLKRMYASARERVGQVSAYLQKVAPDKPVFVWVHLFEPHEPYAAPEGEAESELPRHRYEAEVRYVDRAVGELVQAFRAARPGATVILSADHGEEFGDHGGLYHGTTLYDEQARVPLIWSSPGVVEPGRSKAPVELHDLATSVLAAAGIARDARMRGDDLGAVLAGNGPGPRYAFASIDDLAMVTDGRYKALCPARASDCRLYDLERDPRERDNVAGREPEALERLRAALAAHLGSIAQVEVLPLGEGVGFPEALSRARLGAPGAAQALVPMLASERAEVRAQAARTLGELAHEGARLPLLRLCRDDPDVRVRHEAAIASCALGEGEGCDASATLLDADERTQRRRAARVLATAGRAEGVPVLIDWMMDTEAEERERIAALQSLESLGARAAEPALIELLDDVRLRPLAARALGALGTRAGAAALAAQLAKERYPPARAAEVRALLALDDTRARPLLVRMLGTDSGVPGGVALLARTGALSERPSELGVLVEADGAALRGAWHCPEPGTSCRPGSGARLRLGRRPGTGPARVVLWTEANEATTLEVAGRRLRVPAGEGQVGFSLDAVPRALAFGASPDVRVRGVATVPCREDIPPPPPEPWGEDAP